MSRKEPFYSYRTFLRRRYGRNIYRIPVNLDFSCPNRKNGGGGCVFCGEQGAMAVHLKSGETLEKQVQRSLDYTRTRYGKDAEFMAYFQAYTSTNAPIAEIRSAFEKVLSLAEFRAVTVSTRPDCLPPEVLDYFSELAERYDFWVELGMQTAKDETLDLVNRGHNFAVAESAVKELASRGVNVAAHVIIGLPSETRDDYRQTAIKLGRLPITGIKIHNLHVVKNTQLEQWYKNPDSSHPPVKVLDEHEYGEELIDFIRHLPPHIPLMRTTSDTPNHLLVAPIWWMKKGQFLDYVHRQMVQRDLYQGDMLQSYEETPGEVYRKVATEDGSYTFFSTFFKEKFHSSAGALSEAKHKFIIPSGLDERLQQGKVSLLDVGFGLGCNALSAFELAEGREIDIVSFEFDRQAVAQAAHAYPQWKEIYQALLETGVYQDGKRSIRIMWGDARHNIRTLAESGASQFDVIFHDSFSTQKNTELWTLSFFRQETFLLKPTGAIVTYSNASPVRSALLKCGLSVGATNPFGRAKGGTIAVGSEGPALELPEKELRVINETTAAVPYSDPLGNWSRKRILAHRERVVKKLQELGVPKNIKFER